jgi:intracellular sulfur oxidation DsrE/DsrF family protein
MIEHTDGEQASTARRGFLERLLGSTAAFAILGATPKPAVASEVVESRAGFGPGDDWMDELKGKHRAVFDVAAHKNGKPLTQAKSYLDAWRDGFKVPEHDLNLIIGVHGEAIPIVLSDALWARYKIGEQYEVIDGGTKGPGLRNLFSAQNADAGGLVTPEQSVEDLQRRGVRFVICMNTIAGATKKLSGAGLGAAEEIRTALLGGLLPRVITVPAMLVTLTQLQERGVRYLKIA